MFEELLPPLQWIVAGGFWRALIICLIICPGIPQLLGIVCHSYWAPWHPRYQFAAYMPANPILAVFIALTSTTFDHGQFTVPGWVNASALWGAFVVYIVLNLMDLKSNYTIGQMLSANKIYHNALYFWYGYFGFICYVGMWGTDASLLTKLLISVPGVVWLAALVSDNLASQETQARRFKYAHAYYYRFIWTPKAGFRNMLRRVEDDSPTAYV